MERNMVEGMMLGGKHQLLPPHLILTRQSLQGQKVIV
jgi:hypothetical protein